MIPRKPWEPKAGQRIICTQPHKTWLAQGGEYKVAEIFPEARLGPHSFLFSLEGKGAALDHLWGPARFKPVTYEPHPNHGRHFGKSNRVFKCDDCDNEPDAPMLIDEVWYQFAGPKTLLCIACTERRMERPIEIPDLRDCVGNAFTRYLYDKMNRGLERSFNPSLLPEELPLLMPARLPGDEDDED